MDNDNIIENVKFNEKGLVPAVLQDVNTNEVLMVAYMNRESLKKTLKTNKACFWSRSREELWLKGETSGNYQQVKEIRFDCDNDTLLVKVKPEGPACHTGKKSCFYKNIEGKEVEDSQENFLQKALFLRILYQLIQDRKKNLPPDSYTSYLLKEGIDKIGKKIGEEAAEVIIAAKNKVKEEIVYESADLIYHLLVLLVLNNVTIEEVMTELEGRHGQ